MAFQLTANASLATLNTNLEPQLVLEINGVETLFGAVKILKIIRYGDDIFYGDPGLVYGGTKLIENQKDYISLKGTTTAIKQSLYPDKGAGSTISSMKITLVDKNKEVTELLKPDDTESPTFDLLGRKARVWLGFASLSWKEDFIIVHKGIIDDMVAGPGFIEINIAHPDQKKKAVLFEKKETILDGNLSAVATTIPVESTTGFLKKVLGPDGLYDPSISFYVQIDDEIIKYDDFDGTNFLTCTRAQFNTNADTHDDEATVSSFIVIEGNTIDLALKLMLGGKEDYYQTDVEITNFNQVSGTENIPNTIFFQGFDVDIQRDYGVSLGDYITTTGSSFGANNVTLKPIIGITKTDIGTYIEIDDVTFVTEMMSAAVISFRSQYDTFPAGAGLAMDAEDVDVDQHQALKRNFLSSHEQRHYIKDTVDNGKEFIESQLYLPSASFSVPRKTKASVNYHVGPLPTQQLKILADDNIKDPDKIKIRRTIAKNFNNTIIFRYEELPLEDKFIRGTVAVSAESLDRIPVGKKGLVIESKGLRADLNGGNLANTASERLLDRYRFGAEFIEGMGLNFKTGFDLEIGDIAVLDLSSVQISDSKTGSREGEPRLFEVINKTLDLKSFDVKVDLVDTAFDLNARYGLISASSKIKSATDQKTFVIKQTGNSLFGANEYKKWEQYIGCGVKVRDVDFTVIGTSFLESVDGNTITLTSNLGFVPLEDYRMELDFYDTQTDIIKLIYVFMSDGTNNFSDGRQPYQMI